jgi:hypothetical protein
MLQLVHPLKAANVSSTHGHSLAVLTCICSGFLEFTRFLLESICAEKDSKNIKETNQVNEKTTKGTEHDQH